MRTDRRGFLRALGGGLALLGARPGLGDTDTDGAPEIHRATSNTSVGPLGPKPPRPDPPGLAYKIYPGAKTFPLPAPKAEPGLPLAEVLRGYAPTAAFGCSTSPTASPAATSVGTCALLLPRERSTQARSISW